MGSVPVVNATGGLKDTVWPYNEADETGRGFTFQSYNADDFLAAIDRALALYYNEAGKMAGASPKIIWRSIPAGKFRRRNTWRCSRTSADSKRP